MAPEQCKISVLCYTTAAVLLLSAVNSVAQPLPQSCSYSYLIVPHSPPDCNPVRTSERVDLVCITTVRPVPPTQIYWFRSSQLQNESACVNETMVNHDGIKYFIQEVANEDRDMVGFLEHGSRLRIADFGANDTGYYWCQIVVGCLIRLQPSQPVYIERNDSLVGCGQGLFTGVGGLCAELDPTSTEAVTSTTAISNDPTPTSSSVPIPTPLPPTDQESVANKLLVWQLSTAGLGTLTILLVLLLAGIAIQYTRWKRRPDNRQVQLRRAAHIQHLSSVLSRHQQTVASDQQTRGQELMLQGIIPSYIDMNREQCDPHLSIERLHEETSEFYSPIQESLDTKYETIERNNPTAHYVNIPFNEAGRYQPLCVETLDSPNPYTIRMKTLPPTVTLKDGGKEYCICDKDQVDRPRVYQLPTQSGSNKHEED